MAPKNDPGNEQLPRKLKNEAFRLDQGSASRGDIPPLYSFPSTSSLRSSKSIRSLQTVNDPTIGTYVNKKYGSTQESSGQSTPLLEKQNNHFDRIAYLTYYVPILKWLPHYQWKTSFLGDVLAGISLASFQTPLVMSFATSLAHIPPVFGLYSVIIAACIYSIFGTVPVLIVGPSPAIALMIGQAIESAKNHKNTDHFTQSDILSSVGVTIGAVLLLSGLFRVGFLDKLLSRALLKGFLGAMGVIMVINELATQTGLFELSLNEPHLSTIDKVVFLVRHYKESHILTLMISIITLVCILTTRKLKAVLVQKYNFKGAIYVPELLLMVIVSTFLSWMFEWHSSGVEIVGNVKSGSNTISLSNPFQKSKIPLYKELLPTGLVCTMLGYFDSVTGSKDLSTQYHYDMSSNRDLVALGLVNFVVGLVGALPSFGALGRSRLNLLAGATSPISTIVMSIVAFFTLRYLLDFIYFLPECVLALCTTLIGITITEDIPTELTFFWRIKGYDELLTFALTFFTTILWSVKAGVSLGFLIAVFRVVKQGTKSRIQILGRVPHSNSFRNADNLIEECFKTHSSDKSTTASDVYDSLVAEIEEIEGVLIVSIPEPLTFANSWTLKESLLKIERYGTLMIHRSQPATRAFNNKTIEFVIIDCKGMDSMDTSATQVLLDVVRKYINMEIIVTFSRVPLNNRLRDKFKRSGIVTLVRDRFERYMQETHGNRPISHSPRGLASAELGEGFFLSIEEALKSTKGYYA